MHSSSCECPPLRSKTHPWSSKLARGVSRSPKFRNLKSESLNFVWADSLVHLGLSPGKTLVWHSTLAGTAEVALHASQAGARVAHGRRHGRHRDAHGCSGRCHCRRRLRLRCRRLRPLLVRAAERPRCCGRWRAWGPSGSSACVEAVGEEQTTAEVALDRPAMVAATDNYWSRTTGTRDGERR